ncbi:hypothetical protein EVAR_55219_1 [Eumeta japonica]|uniref:Uncharacterized protein n=1 Tax=Eumeta variegata TaxID=151549 RepID=A0A4C1ZNR5_EUMVA|nr:hypothetical protein EVAR_55219_1 [Eumeta japonica]
MLGGVYVFVPLTRSACVRPPPPAPAAVCAGTCRRYRCFVDAVFCSGSEKESGNCTSASAEQLRHCSADDRRRRGPCGSRRECRAIVFILKDTHSNGCLIYREGCEYGAAVAGRGAGCGAGDVECQLVAAERETGQVQVQPA